MVFAYHPAMSTGTKTRVLITGGDIEACACYTGSYRRMMTDLLYSGEFLDLSSGRTNAAGNIYLDLSQSEDDDPNEGPLLAKWQAIVEIRDGEKAITSLTIRGPDGDELQ